MSKNVSKIVMPLFAGFNTQSLNGKAKDYVIEFQKLTYEDKVTNNLSKHCLYNAQLLQLALPWLKLVYKYYMNNYFMKGNGYYD